MSAKRALIMPPADNVATAIEEICAGEEVGARIERTVLIVDAVEVIPFGFKVSLT